MARLVILQHTPTAATRLLGDAVLAGARTPEIEGVLVQCLSPLTASADDLRSADALLLGTPANFGYMSGALKHFFDSAFLALGGALDADGGSTAPATHSARALPYGLWVHGRYDTTGAVRSVTALAQALPWRPAARPLEWIGEVSDLHQEQAFELGATLAALASLAEEDA